MNKLKFLYMMMAAMLVLPLTGFADGAGHGTIGGGPGSKGSVNLDAIFGGANSNAPLVQGNNGENKGIEDWDELNENGGNKIGGPEVSDSGTDNRSREFGHRANLRTGADKLPNDDFAQLEADFRTEGIDGFVPGSIGGNRFISSLSNQWNPNFGSDMPNDFLVLPTSSHEGSIYCGDDF